MSGFHAESGRIAANCNRCSTCVSRKTAVLERLVHRVCRPLRTVTHARVRTRVTRVMHACILHTYRWLYLEYIARHTLVSPTGFLIRLNDGSSVAAAQSFFLRGVTRAFNRVRRRKRSRFVEIGLNTRDSHMAAPWPMWPFNPRIPRIWNVLPYILRKRIILETCVDIL